MYNANKLHRDTGRPRDFIDITRFIVITAARPLVIPARAPIERVAKESLGDGEDALRVCFVRARGESRACVHPKGS